MSELEVGQQVAASNESIEVALKSAKDDVHKYYYLITLTNGNVIVRVVREDGSDYASRFNYVTAMPEGENNMNEEFKVGQQVVVRNNMVEPAPRGVKVDGDRYYYLCTLMSGRVVVRAVKPDGSDYASCFNYVTAMPEEQKVTMFTPKTFPRGLVYVRYKDSLVVVESENLVLGIRQHTIATSSGSPTYARLAESFEMSLDNGETWVPCGEL